MKSLNNQSSNRFSVENPQKHSSNIELINQDPFCLQNRIDVQLLRIKVQEHLKLCQTMWNLNQVQLSQVISIYRPLICYPLKIKNIHSLPNIKLVKSVERIYFGQIQNKKKHGLGISLYNDSKIYQGQFHDNQKHGKAIQIYSNGNLYIGDFYHNKKHGTGTFYWFNLSEIPCTKNSQILIQNYQGQWWGGLPDGQGQHYKANGDVYIGKFKNGLKHGAGIEYYANCDFYQGQYVNGLPEGYGKYIWKDKSSYKGDFKQGYKNGYGIWKDKNQIQSYQGHYMLDKKHGYGVYYWGDEYIYKGNYVEDKIQGQGKLINQQEIVYEGKCKDGYKMKQLKQRLKGNNKLDVKKSEKKLVQQQINSNMKERSYSKERSLNNSNYKQRNLLNQKGVISIQTQQKKYKLKNKNYCVAFKTNLSRIGHRGCTACDQKIENQNNRNSSRKRVHSNSNSPFKY